MKAITVEFAGGLQHLFGGSKYLKLTTNSEKITELIKELRNNFLKESPEMFVNENGLL